MFGPSPLEVKSAGAFAHTSKRKQARTRAREHMHGRAVRAVPSHAIYRTHAKYEKNAEREGEKSAESGR